MSNHPSIGRTLNGNGSFWRALFGSQIIGVFGVLVVIVVVSHFLSPHFSTSYNAGIMMRTFAFAGLVALGQCLLLLLGELDLSIGAIAGLCAVIGGKLMVDAQINPYLAFGLCIMLGMLCGMINGIIVTTLRLNALVVTIGMTGIYSGANLVITEGKAIVGIPKVIHFLGQGDIGGIPMPFIILLVVGVIVTVLALCTPFGRYIYAIGNNREAARMLGIRVNFVRVSCFMIAGGLAALAGMLMVARLGSAQPSIGNVWVMASIAAPVIGGIATTGGIGNPIGALIGAAIIGVIENIIVLFGVSPYWQTIVSGAIVVLAISFDSISRNFLKKEGG
ncbi:permease component of ribose/xylose/arabinose/galactoside ABC-type transporter [Opitutaceae bacterium TAV1]|nr:permease component of ribose/xylose/arabinose/galactoside ABC-type transporter [Opitutaceae bacterium TAV1]